MTIAVTTPNHIKAKMRKMKTVPACIKAELLKGCRNQGAYMQFHQDVKTYNLWEALLFVQSFEQETWKFFAEGTAHNAMDAYFNTKAVAKLLQLRLS